MRLYLLLGGLIASLCLAVYVLYSGKQTVEFQKNALESQVQVLDLHIKNQVKVTAERDEIDKKYSEELRQARSEITDLRAAVATGAKRLRVKATCPAVLPTTPRAPGVDDGAWVELATSSREDYFKLREQLIENENKLKGLQDYVRNVCLESENGH